MPGDEHLRRLQCAFRFDTRDLAANRAGVLSQNQSVQQPHFAPRRVDCLILVPVLALLFLNIYLVGLCLRDGSVVAVMLEIMLARVTYLALDVLAQDWHERTLMVEGQARLMDVRHRRLVIGHVKFTLTPAQYRAVRTGCPYRVYYLRGQHHVLSIEPDDEAA